MSRSKNRVKTKLPSDGPSEYNGPPVKTFDECNSIQKRLVIYHKLYQWLYGLGRKGVRIPLPSCCVLRIQCAYSDPSPRNV